MRYPLTLESTLRTHESHVEDANEAEETRHPIGVKRPSVVQNEEHLDLKWSLPPEYQHGVVLGVVKSLCDM